MPEADSLLLNRFIKLPWCVYMLNSIYVIWSRSQSIQMSLLLTT